MSGATSDRQSTLKWVGWAASCIVILVLTLPWTIWVLNSPMAVFSRKFSTGIFFPPDGPEDRFQYFRQLVVAHGERARYVTCVLCSVTVRGTVLQQVTALWGDVTVDGDGRVGQGVEVNGGRVMLRTGARVSAPPLSAIGGSVIIEPSVQTYPAFVRSVPGFFYPGQRSWPSRGIAFFTLVVLVVSACGGWVVLGAFRERVDAAVRLPVRSAVVGMALFALVWPVLYLAVLFLYIFPPLTALLYVAVPIVSWFILAIGFAAVTEWIGSRLVGSNRSKARLTGAGLLLALMLVPVVGLFVMIAVILVGLGAGTGILLWPRLGSGIRSLLNH
jgi:hypothetical protein